MRKTLKAVMGLCVLAGVLFIGGAAPSGAQECGGYLNPCPPPGEDVLEFTYDNPVVSGGKIHIFGSCTIDDVVEFTIGGQFIGSVEPDEDGNFDVTFDVPNLEAGTYEIVGTCGEELEAVGDITLTFPGTTPTTPTNNTVTTGGTTSTPLARTGFDAAPMVTLGAAALVLGGAAVYGSKRRRTA